jgi:hypothetical protein
MRTEGPDVAKRRLSWLMTARLKIETMRFVDRIDPRPLVRVRQESPVFGFIKKNNNNSNSLRLEWLSYWAQMCKCFRYSFTWGRAPILLPRNFILMFIFSLKKNRSPKSEWNKMWYIIVRILPNCNASCWHERLCGLAKVSSEILVQLPNYIKLHTRI